MADYLRAGALSDDWSNPATVSMARDIEVALEQLLAPLPPDDDSTPRRKLAIAIATGVINHLQHNAGAFSIAVPNLPGPTVAVHPTIEVQE
jgi:hypothetical protein